MKRLQIAMLLCLLIFGVWMAISVRASERQYEQWRKKDAQAFEQFKQEPVLWQIYAAQAVGDHREVSRYEILPTYAVLPDTLWVYAVRGGVVMGTAQYQRCPNYPATGND